MSEEEKGAEAEAPEAPKLGPDGLPAPEDRAAALTIVMDKQGCYYMIFPEPLWISLQLLAHAQALFANMIRDAWEQAQAAASRRIITAPPRIPPHLLDPKYQRRQ